VTQFPTDDEATMKRLEEYDVYEIPLGDIWVDPDFNCRESFSPESIRSLAESIESEGLEFPVVLQRQEDSALEFPTPYRLVAGFRRYEAVKCFLKGETIRANIRLGLTDREAEVLNVTENLERKDLNPLEEAKSLQKLFPGGAPLRVVAKEVKRSCRWVHQRLRLLTLPEALQRQVAAGLLSLLDVEILVTLPEEEQVKAAKEIIAAQRRKRFVNTRYRRKFRFRRTKEEVNARIAQLLGLGLGGLVTRFGAWFAGYITDEEFDHDISLAKKGEL
jgi:ParB family chromosome partitioning protein